MCAPKVAGSEGTGGVAGSLLPCGLHTSAKDRPAGTSERERDLSHSVPRGVGDLAHDCGRSQTSRRCDWVSCSPSHLGTEPSFASASPLRRAGRRHQSRRRTLDQFWGNVLSSCSGAELSLPEHVSDLSEG